MVTQIIIFTVIVLIYLFINKKLQTEKKVVVRIMEEELRTLKIISDRSRVTDQVIIDSPYDELQHELLFLMELHAWKEFLRTHTYVTDRNNFIEFIEGQLTDPWEKNYLKF